MNMTRRLRRAAARCRAAEDYIWACDALERSQGNRITRAMVREAHRALRVESVRWTYEYRRRRERRVP